MALCRVLSVEGKTLQFDDADVDSWSNGVEVVETDGEKTLGDKHYLHINFKPGKRAEWVTPDGSAE